MSLKISVSVAHKLGFTSHQNAVPLLRELVLHNESDQMYQDLTLHLQTTPAVLEAKQWKIDRLLPHSTLDIRDRDIKLDAKWLAELTESVVCEITLCLRQGEDELLQLIIRLKPWQKMNGAAMRWLNCCHLSLRLTTLRLIVCSKPHQMYFVAQGKEKPWMVTKANPELGSGR